MSEQDKLVTDPNWGAAPEKPAQPEGYWEDRGIGGKVWHPPVGNERSRVDNSVLGLPPEMAVASGLSIAGAAANAGSGALAKTAAATKALASMGGTYIKYEALKHGFQAMGIPWYVADALAIAGSGYRKGGGAAAAEGMAAEGAAAEAAATNRPSQMTQEQIYQRVKAGAANPAPPPVKPERPPITVTERNPSAPPETPSAAPAPVAGPPPAPAPPVSAPPAAPAPEAPAAPPKPSLSAAEAKRYLQLRAQNMTDAKAREILQAERKLSAGLPTDADVQAAVGERNATGNWAGSGPPPSAEARAGARRSPPDTNVPQGKAAQDLARGASPPRPAPGPKSTVQDVAKKTGHGIDEEQAVLNLQLQTENESRLANRNAVTPHDLQPLRSETFAQWKARTGQTSQRLFEQLRIKTP